MRHRRRAEGQTEYIIITSFMSACLIVGLFRFGGEVKKAITRAKVCVNCPTDEEAETDGTEGEGEKTTTGEGEEGAEGGSDGEGQTGPLPWYADSTSSFYWVAQLLRWFGGAPHFWDFVLPH